MTIWLAPNKAAKYIKNHSPETMIGERTLRTLIKNGFPCLKVETRQLINMDTFEDDLIAFSAKQTQESEEQKLLESKGKMRKIIA